MPIKPDDQENYIAKVAELLIESTVNENYEGLAVVRNRTTGDVYVAITMDTPEDTLWMTSRLSNLLLTASEEQLQDMGFEPRIKNLQLSLKHLS